MLNTITAIKNRHQGHWFEPGTLRFFNSKFPRRAVYPVPDGAFFISSEFSKGVYISTGWIPDGPVRWSVRFCSEDDGSISTVSVSAAAMSEPPARIFSARPSEGTQIRESPVELSAVSAKFA